MEEKAGGRDGLGMKSSCRILIQCILASRLEMEVAEVSQCQGTAARKLTVLEPSGGFPVPGTLFSFAFTPWSSNVEQLLGPPETMPGGNQPSPPAHSDGPSLPLPAPVPILGGGGKEQASPLPRDVPAAFAWPPVLFK